MTGDGAAGGRGSALQRGLQLLEAVCAADRPIGLPELTEVLDLPKQTAHRIARQLEEDGYLRREPLRDRFLPGPKLGGLALDALRAGVHWAPVRAVLEDLVAEIRETCNIGVLDGTAVVYLDRVECDWPLRMQLHAGSRVPFHCTAIGKLLVAHLSATARTRLLATARLERFTERTVTDVRSLEAGCEAVRRQGWAENDEEYHVGLVGLAVPVPLGGGAPRLALSVHGPAPRIDIARARGYVATMQGAATRIGAILENEGG